MKFKHLLAMLDTRNIIADVLNIKREFMQIRIYETSQKIEHEPFYATFTRSELAYFAALQQTGALAEDLFKVNFDDRLRAVISCRGLSYEVSVTFKKSNKK